MFGRTNIVPTGILLAFSALCACGGKSEEEGTSGASSAAANNTSGEGGTDSTFSGAGGTGEQADGAASTSTGGTPSGGGTTIGTEVTEQSAADFCVEEKARYVSCGIMAANANYVCEAPSVNVGRCEAYYAIRQSCAVLTSLLCAFDYSGVVAIYASCASATWDCGDGTTYTSAEECDGVSDCATGADESGCAGRFTCSDGASIPLLAQCDGFVDCDDGSDEMPCATPRFECADGASIPLLARCNGPTDCDDGSDEVNCPTTFWEAIVCT